MPAADIAGNPYWQRDVRRNYPRLSTFRQSDIAGLVSVGSAANPRIGVGEVGAQQLVVIKEGGGKGVLSLALEKGGEKAISEVLGAGGLPPLPGTGVSWVLDKSEGFPKKYATPAAMEKLVMGILIASLDTHAGPLGRPETTEEGKIESRVRILFGWRRGLFSLSRRHQASNLSYHQLSSSQLQLIH